MNEWKNLLKSLGFNESEAGLYLLSLELGPASVQDLAAKAKVSRVTTYAVIESLMADGLMSTVQKGKKNLYVAESPDRLVSFMNNRLKNMESTLRQIEHVLPELKLVQRGEKPVVKLLDGIEGLKALQQDIIESSPNHTLEFGNIDNITAVFSRDELQPFRERLATMDINGRFLYASHIKHTPRKGVEARHIHHEKIRFNGDVIIYKNKVALSTFHGKLITVIIESAVIAETMTALFELAWHSALIEQ